MLDPAPDPIESAKAAFDFLREVPGLRRVAETNGGEYKGPCPVCGGTDRFVCWPAPREGHPRAWCRQCHETPMNGLDFLMWRDGLDFAAVCRKLNIPLPKGRPVAWYDYRGSNGELLYQVVRYDPKRFVCRAPRGLRPRNEVDTDWSYKLDGVDRVLYHVPELIASREAGAVVWLCEGEKDADALTAAGEMATTNPHGAGSWRAAYAELLRDRLVVAVPDADADGAKWIAAVTASVAPVARRFKVVRLPAGCKDVSDYLAAHTMDDLAALAAAAPVVSSPVENPAPDAPPGRFRVLDDAAIDALPPPTWLIDQVLIAGAVNVLYGPGGSGKSVLAIDAACALAAGLPTWHGHATAPGPVVYIGAEAPEEVAQRRRAWKADHQIPTLPAFFLVPERVPLLDSEAVPGLIASLPAEAARPALFVVDTLSRTMRGGDENSGQDMGRVFEAAEQLRDATGATILLIHHSGKDASRGARGSSSLTFDARQAIAVSREESVVTVAIEKHNNSADAPDLRFVLRTVPDPGSPDAETVVLGEAAPGDYVDGRLPAKARAVLVELCDTLFAESGAALGALEKALGWNYQAVYRAIKDLVARAYVQDVGMARSRDHRFKATARGFAAVGVVPPWQRRAATLTSLTDPTSAPQARSDDFDTALTGPADQDLQSLTGPEPPATHSLTSLTVFDTSLTVFDKDFDIFDSSLRAVKDVKDSPSADEAITPDGDPAPQWESPPDSAPPRPAHLGYCGHSAIQWDAGEARWRCRSCWEIRRE